MKIFISIATYNEKENIEKLILQIFDLKIEDLSIVVTDDNSPDNTSQIVEKLREKFSNLYLIKRTGKLGYGSAHIAGFKFALKRHADIIISMDADLSHNSDQIPELIDHIKAGNDVVIASRKIKGGRVIGWSPWRKFCSASAMFISRLTLRLKTHDVTNGFRAYQAKVFNKIDFDSIKSNGYSFLEEIIYKLETMRFKIKEIPSTFVDREDGKSKFNNQEIINFFWTIFKLKIKQVKNFELTSEKSIYIIIGISFFIGLWHALPLVKVVADEMYFVGGVLRAMESHSILPHINDVPYGILTYFLNYILIGIFLVILLPFYSLSIGSLKIFLVSSPHIIYFIPRLVSALIAIALLSLFVKILSKEFKDYRVRVFLIFLLFSNMLTTLILHTGKVWVLSIVLVLLSFYYLYRSIGEPKNKYIFLSILFSFLAVVNLPFFAFAFINLPILFIHHRGSRKKIIKYTLISLVVFILILSLNFGSTMTLLFKQLTDYNPILEPINDSDNLSVIASLWLNIKKVLVFFPLFLLTLLLVASSRIRNKSLFVISIIYFLAYFISLSVLGTWSTDLYSYIRYSFPLGFFLILIIASFNIKFKKIFYAPALISLIYFIPTLYFLSMPTTLNQARNYILNNLNEQNTVIKNEIRTLELPKNKKTYQMYSEYYCASKCQNTLEENLNNEYEYVVIDKYTRSDIYLPPEGIDIYNVDFTNRGEVIAEFINSPDDEFSLDGHMANYFDLNFFRIKNFGPDIYIYK
jgi:dolichol-phosphate mannosyltransferase